MRGQDGCPEICGGRSGVNRADEGLGQPWQVMTAGTQGPSGQLIFDVVVPPAYMVVKQHCSEVVLS